MPVEISEFQGHKIIKLSRKAGDRYPFAFGLVKAEMIINNFDAIKKFVEENKGK